MGSEWAARDEGRGLVEREGQRRLHGIERERVGRERGRAATGGNKVGFGEGKRCERGRGNLGRERDARVAEEI